MVIRIGVVGLGGIAQYAHIPSYKKIKGVDIVGATDINKNLGKAICDKHNLRYYSNYRELIDQNKLDAISICTPPFARLDIVKYAAENNVNILCEKPMANSLSSSFEMMNAIEKNHIQFMMGFSLRFSEWYKKAHDFISLDRLGEIIFSNSTFACPLPPYSWFLDREKSGGGVIIDRGSHIIDIVTWFFGMPRRVYAVSLNKRIMDVEESGFLILEHSKSISQIALSFGVNKSLDRVEICGTACNLIIDHEMNTFFFLPQYKSILKDYLLDIPKNALKAYLSAKKISNKDDMYFNEIDYFIKCLKDGRQVSPNYLDGINNMKIIDACYKSMGLKNPVEI